MNSQEFIHLALKTESTPMELPINKTSVQAALGMAIACSNVMDQIKKLIIYGKNIDLETLSNNIREMQASGDYLEATMNYGGSHLPVTNKQINTRLLHAAIGMFTESGEMLEALSKQIDGFPLDKVNFGEEVGDNFWYGAIAIDELGISEESIKSALILKLAKRYGGKFSAEGALIRNLEAERKVLEETLVEAL